MVLIGKIILLYHTNISNFSNFRFVSEATRLFIMFVARWLPRVSLLSIYGGADIVFHPATM
jgi:hypothetical protein